MRLLFLSFYYPPDLSAGSFRSYALINALQEAGKSELEIDLLTTMPNRYQGMSDAAPKLENNQGMTINRIPLPSHNSGMLDQSRAFGVYARAVLRHVRYKPYDAIFATSSRLMTAALAAYVARRECLPLYLDIRDLFTDTIGDLFDNSIMKFSLPLMHMIERRCFRTAQRINIVSEGFADHIERVAPAAEIRSFTNGIDDEFLNGNFEKVDAKTSDLPLIVYAGNIGEGQGLHHIVPQAAKRLAGRARFRIIGDGGRSRQLADALRGAQAEVELLSPVPRTQLHHHYREADILFLHLNAYSAFKKVLPSKIFEYGATGKPILAGVDGFAARFLREALPQAAVFAPLEISGLVRAFDTLMSSSSEPADRQTFRERYARRAIMQHMAQDLTEFMSESKYNRL